MSCEEPKNDCADPGSDEAFDSLFRAELDQLGTAKGDATDIGKDIVATSFKRSVSPVGSEMPTKPERRQ